MFEGSATPPREIAEYLEEAVQLRRVDDGEETSDDAFPQFLRLAAALRDRGAGAVDACWQVFISGDAIERATVADLFGWIVDDASPELRYRCLDYLTAALAREVGGADDQDVLDAVTSAIGRCEDPRGLPSLLRLAHHDVDAVRFAVARALPSTCGWEPVPAAIDCLVVLSRDRATDVRDWACFGLGQLAADSPTVRDALGERLRDPDLETRCEALLALSQLGDDRAYVHLAERAESGELVQRELDAVAALGDVRLSRLLARVDRSALADDDEEEWRARLAFAICRCDRDAHQRARELEMRLVAALDAAVAGKDLHVTTLRSYPHTRLIVVTMGGTTRLDEAVWDADGEPKSFTVEYERDWYLKMLAGGVE